VTSPDLAVSKTVELPVDLGSLLEESLREGFRFLQRLSEEWHSGSNRFSEPGEALFVARHRGMLVGICGLNRDPYASDPATGRLRRLYVAPAFRGRGVGRALVHSILSCAPSRFAVLRVRTDSPDADLFYRALGFSPLESSDEATHELALDPGPAA